MDKIIIEDNIPEPDYLSTRPGVQKIEGVWIPVNNKYKVECIRAIATLKKGQSFLVHSRCEYTVKDWIYRVKRRYEDRYFEIKTIKSEKGIQVEINGDLFNCTIIKKPLYDPSGQKMRS